MRSVLLGVLVVWVWMLAGCGPRPVGGHGGAGGSAGAGGAGGSAGNVPFAVTSSAFTEGSPIPAEQQCTQISGGQNTSPALSWTPGPAGTQSYAIVMRDLDIGFTHWVIWDIPANVTSLPAGVQTVFQPATPSGAKQAALNATIVGYFGPCSPTTVNTYEFRVYALPVASVPGLGQASTLAEAQAAIESQDLASAAVSGES
ncbi:MAG TPA: YbhB/YbcL family Raf kinase inhibitor-like protein [Polyangiaceae bacterium]|nr:YbhB/YbcL family Raf kinase inhibitor-like protein [Polyangiaceae bacterium]